MVVGSDGLDGVDGGPCSPSAGSGGPYAVGDPEEKMLRAAA
jgi:hypothetical protein